jgi:hypothetical protein
MVKIRPNNDHEETMRLRITVKRKFITTGIKKIAMRLSRESNGYYCGRLKCSDIIQFDQRQQDRELGVNLMSNAMILPFPSLVH